MVYRGRRSFGSQSFKNIVKCIYAVVDALPPPLQVASNINGSPHTFSGTEGLAVFLSSERRPGHSVYTQVSTHDEEGIGSNPTLTFTSIARSSIFNASADQAMLNTCRLGLPVANTIFVNGQRTIFFEDSWQVNFRETEDPLINYLYRKPLTAYHVNLGCDPDGFIRGGSSPLQQLTKPRKITGSMGNVLAQVEIEGEAVPASQELEKAVPAYIASNPMSTAKGPVLVYALICPETMVPSFEASIEDKQNPSERVLGALWRGAKLFKVSGGGGGWGKRQGLLSLDAAVNFEGSEAASTAGFPDLDSDQSILEEFGSRGIIPKSSTVEFLVHSPGSASTESAGQAPVSPVIESEYTTVILGTTTDPESHGELVKVDSMDAGVRFLPNHFGMISYGGSALSSTTHAAGRIQQGFKSAETRLDVPDSLFIFRDIGKHHRKPKLPVRAPEKNLANLRIPRPAKPMPFDKRTAESY